MVYLYIYLGIGLIYALWIWLFKGATIFSIPVNTVLGPVYILGVFWHFLTWRKTTVHSVFQGKKAVIFDLDGTILDNQPAWDEAIENVKKNAGLQVERNYPSGLNITEKWISLLSSATTKPALSAEELAKMTVEEFMRIYTTVEARPGFWSLIRYLKENGFKIGLASNSNRPIIDELLRRMGVEDQTAIFDAVLSADDVSMRKPHPEIYNKTLKALKVSARNTVAFEDSTTGAASGVAADIATIIVWDGEVPKAMYPRKSLLFIDDFDGLDRMIEKSPRDIVEEEIKEVNEQRAQAAN